MSFPNIPDINPTINLKREQVIDMLLASIAKEEEGLARIIDVEGEKLQYILSRLQGHCAGGPETIKLQEMNREVRKTLQTVLKNQMLLKMKLEDVMEMVPPISRPPQPPGPPGPSFIPRPCKIVLAEVRHSVPKRKKTVPQRRKEIKVVRKARPRDEE